MPQMAPMNWSLLFIYFIMIFMYSIILNYFSIIYIKPPQKIYNKMPLLNWKW
ncbi:ATP synthase F0 subunit 8 (mitochondrion) [Sitophilus oryzae]|uniref:ATP synthase complex subunit 8 n=1 Tax=Sitophilus oryzae TaxID=7048 RepID=A0A1B1UUL5_SITOR|nr:ATP synthase F0 subunit 8 [Sitophilus oryzae]ANW06523.1 ATP synthase F0 subunit 8 [Sitophilus oryzae]AQD17666.1 ATP synthase F0 subunit 8 [Sitophilus oryzae]